MFVKTEPSNLKHPVHKYGNLQLPYSQIVMQRPINLSNESVNFTSPNSLNLNLRRVSPNPSARSVGGPSPRTRERNSPRVGPPNNAPFRIGTSNPAITTTTKRDTPRRYR